MALLGWVPGLEEAADAEATDAASAAPAAIAAAASTVASTASDAESEADNAIAGAGSDDGLLQPRFIHNASGRFESRWAAVRVERDTRCVLLRGMQGAGTHLEVAMRLNQTTWHTLEPDSAIICGDPVENSVRISVAFILKILPLTKVVCTAPPDCLTLASRPNTTVGPPLSSLFHSLFILLSARRLGAARRGSRALSERPRARARAFERTGAAALCGRRGRGDRGVPVQSERLGCVRCAVCRWPGRQVIVIATCDSSHIDRHSVFAAKMLSARVSGICLPCLPEG